MGEIVNLKLDAKAPVSKRISLTKKCLTSVMANIEGLQTAGLRVIGAAECYIVEHTDGYREVLVGYQNGVNASCGHDELIMAVEKLLDTLVEQKGCVDDET